VEARSGERKINVTKIIDDMKNKIMSLSNEDISSQNQVSQQSKKGKID
jgi:hypothetical protein